MSDISDLMYEQGFHDGYQQALSELNDKQFVKVTRCMGCIYAVVAPDDNGYFYCEHPRASEKQHESHYYCAFGEPREGGQE